MLRGTLNGLIFAVMAGVAFTLTKMLLSYISAVKLALVIFALTNLGLLVILSVQGKLTQTVLAGKRPLIYLIGLMAGILNLLFYFGLDTVNPTTAAILTRSDLLFSLILGVVLHHQRLRSRELVGMVVMVFGMLMVLNISLTGFGLKAFGALCLLGNSFLVAVNAELIKTYCRDLDNMVIAFYNSGLQALFYVGWLAVMGGSWNGPKWPGFVILLLGILVLLQILQYYTYYQAIRNLPIWKVRVLTLFIPVTSTLTGVWWLKEQIMFQQILGVVLVVAGLVIINLTQRVKDKAETLVLSK